MPTSALWLPSRPRRVTLQRSFRPALRAGLPRAVRAAIVIPGTFAFYAEVAHDQQAALFAAFGGVCMLLYTEYVGPLRIRIQSYAALMLATAALIAIGTVCSERLWISVLFTAVMTATVLFAGVVSSILAASTTALLVTVVLPVTLGAPPHVVGDRLLGWLTAGALAIVASVVLWPAPEVDALRSATADALAETSTRVSRLGELRKPSSAAATRLRTTFYASPSRPAGLSGSARMLIQVAERALLLSAVLSDMENRGPASDAASLHAQTSDLLDRAARALSGEHADHVTDLETAIDDLDVARETLLTIALVNSHASRGDLAGGSATDVVGAIEPTFLTNELAAIAADLGRYAASEVRERSRSWWQRIVGMSASAPTSPWKAIRDRAGAHLSPNSVWFRTAVRGAVAFSASVLLAKELEVEHAFWVAFGTLAVLRTTGVNTGQTALRALVGTVAGILIGGGLTVAVGSHTSAAWALLPVAIAFTALAPALSFGASQAGFTITLLLLFDIIAPQGWHIGLVRFEDVALGCAVAVAVGALFWPRGAGGVLRGEMAETLRAGTTYLRSSLSFALALCDSSGAVLAPPDLEMAHADDAARRLDNAFRQFSLERGTKAVPTSEVATLTGVAAYVRSTAAAVYDIWRDQAPCTGERAESKLALLQAADAVEQWYQSASASLLTGSATPEPAPLDSSVARHLVESLRADLGSGQATRGGTAVRMIWSLNLLQAVARRESEVASSVAEIAIRVPAPG